MPTNTPARTPPPHDANRVTAARTIPASEPALQSLRVKVTSQFVLPPTAWMIFGLAHAAFFVRRSRAGTSAWSCRASVTRFVARCALTGLYEAGRSGSGRMLR